MKTKALLITAIILVSAGCYSRTVVRSRMKRNVLAGKKIAIIVPDARIYYTTGTDAIVMNDPFEAHEDKGRVTRPQYTKIYQAFKKGVEEVFQVNIDLYDHRLFESNFVFSKYKQPLNYYDIVHIPHLWQATARKYDNFLVIKIIERHSCRESRHFKNYACQSQIIASLNIYEWDSKDKINIRKIDYDDKSFVQFGTTHSFNDYTIADDRPRKEEIAKTKYEYRYAQVKEEAMESAATNFYEWAKLFATNIMETKEPTPE